MTKGAGLRILDDGSTSASRSQALWHGIASSAKESCDPVLSFCRPNEPYVGIGYFASLDEVDRSACRRLGLPIIRRSIGGGPVYLDADQPFFQITLPAHLAPARVDRLYELLLEPAAKAFRELGLPVYRRGLNDLAIGDRKISGTGAGRIRDGVVVVGNLLTRFPYRKMAEVLALPDETLRQRYLDLMKRHVTSVENEGLRVPEYSEICQALSESYSWHLGCCPRADSPSQEESEAICEWQARFEDPLWLNGIEGSRRPGRQVKISGDVWLLAAAHEDLKVEATVVRGRIKNAIVSCSERHGSGRDLGRAMQGQSAEVSTLADSLSSFGPIGDSLVRLLEPGLNALA